MAAKTVSIPRALADYLRREPTVAESESLDPAVQASLGSRRAAATYITGLTKYRAVVTVDHAAAEAICAVADQGLKQPDLHDAVRNAIEAAQRNLRAAFD